MTDQTDQTSHPRADTLADLDAGLLDPAAERDARAHLVGCDRCRADLATLQAVPGRLAAVADAGPVPDDVVRRLDAALAAVAAEPPSPAGTPPGPPRRAAAAVARRTAPRPTPPAAAPRRRRPPWAATR